MQMQILYKVIKEDINGPNAVCGEEDIREKKKRIKNCERYCFVNGLGATVENTQLNLLGVQTREYYLRFLGFFLNIFNNKKQSSWKLKLLLPMASQKMSMKTLALNTQTGFTSSVEIK